MYPLLPQRRCGPRHHQQRYCHRRARFHNDHPVPVLYPGPGHVLRARCPPTVRAGVRARPRKGAQCLHDHSRCDRPHDGGHPLMGSHPHPKTHLLSRCVTEHQYRRCGVLPVGFRRRARRRVPALGLDRASHFRRTAEERGHCHVRVRRGTTVHHHPERRRVHFADLGRGSTDDRGLWSDCVAALHADAALIQVVAFLSRALGTAHVRLDGAIQRARFCCSSIHFLQPCAASLTAFLGHDFAVLLPRDGRHVQLCLGHFGRRDHLRCPHLVLHTCRQVVAPGAD